MADQVPVVEGLFAQTADGPRLLASRCQACGTYYFPRLSRCTNPNCQSASIEEALLGSRGTLYSYTVQHYAPPPPFRYQEPFAPFAIGLVEVPEGLRVLAMLKTEDFSALKLGGPVELVLDPLDRDEAGSEILTWKFKPVDERAGRV